MNPQQFFGPASAWVVRWSHLLPPDARVLDVACGSGRHVRWFAERGDRVTAVDRDAKVVAPLGQIAEIVVADIETGPWPFNGRCFDAVVVTNYLWRARLPDIVAGVAAGGVLIYETFAVGNETVGKPSRPAFLLQPGELLVAAAGLRIVAYEDGFEDATSAAPARFVQRVVAVRTDPARTPAPQHFPLQASTFPAQLTSRDSEDSA